MNMHVSLFFSAFLQCTYPPTRKVRNSSDPWPYRRWKISVLLYQASQQFDSLDLSCSAEELAIQFLRRCATTWETVVLFKWSKACPFSAKPLLGVNDHSWSITRADPSFSRLAVHSRGQKTGGNCGSGLLDYCCSLFADLPQKYTV